MFHMLDVWYNIKVQLLGLQYCGIEGIHILSKKWLLYLLCLRKGWCGVTFTSKKKTNPHPSFILLHPMANARMPERTTSAYYSLSPQRTWYDRQKDLPSNPHWSVVSAWGSAYGFRGSTGQSCYLKEWMATKKELGWQYLGGKVLKKKIYASASCHL